MAKGFFKERKHYTLQNIADILYEKENADLEETRRLVGILKKYGVVKAVKRTKPEFDDLSNEDIVLTDVVDNSNDIEYVFDYVGVVMLEGHVFKCYPKYIETEDEPFEELKQVLKVIKKYNSSEQLIYLFNGEDDSRIFNRLAVALHLLEEYYADGLYTNQKEIIETNGEGEILWDKTINETFAIIQNNKPYYVELQTINTVNNDLDYFRRLHECVLTTCSNELKSVGLLQLFDLSEVNLTQEELSDFGDDNYILYRLQSEIQSQYVTRKQNLLKTIYTYIANVKTDKDDISYSLYGTNSFNLVWEKVCAAVFDNKLNTTLGQLKMSVPLAEEFRSKSKEPLINMIEKPKWKGNDMEEQDAADTLIPDLVSIPQIDGTDYFLIFDAKYYNIQLEKGKSLRNNPGVGDVTKQYLYQLAYRNFIKAHNIAVVKNCFLMPTEKNEIIKKGTARMPMLEALGLENIQIRLIPATLMYEYYLTQRKIDISLLEL